tara:strand:- start:4015 stop:4431 length:417 start_codon:yes stop_codon:yes gene_type:complete
MRTPKINVYTEQHSLADIIENENNKIGYEKKYLELFETKRIVVEVPNQGEATVRVENADKPITKSNDLHYFKICSINTIGEFAGLYTGSQWETVRKKCRQIERELLEQCEVCESQAHMYQCYGYINKKTGQWEIWDDF